MSPKAARGPRLSEFASPRSGVSVRGDRGRRKPTQFGAATFLSDYSIAPGALTRALEAAEILPVLDRGAVLMKEAA